MSELTRVNRSQLVAFAVAFTLGTTAGFILSRPKSGGPPPVDFGSDVVVIRTSSPAEVSRRFRVYQFTVDGKSTHLGDPPAEPGDVWLIELDHGRVRLSATAIAP